MTESNKIQLTRIRDHFNRKTRFSLVVPDEALLEDASVRFIEKLRSAWQELIEASTPTPTGEEADDGE